MPPGSFRPAKEGVCFNSTSTYVDFCVHDRYGRVLRKRDKRFCFLSSPLEFWDDSEGYGTAGFQTEVFVSSWMSVDPKPGAAGRARLTQ